MVESKIKHVYGVAIFERGSGYFVEGRVLNVVKFRNKLFGEIIGTERYNTEVKREYIRGLYERHSRKVNLWREFEWKGITVRRRMKRAVGLGLRS